DQSVASAARCFSSACLLITFSIDLAHAAFAAGRPSGGSMIGVSGGMTTCKFVMGSLDRLSTRRLAVCAQAEHRKVWRSMPHTVVLSRETSIRRISPPHAKHFIMCHWPRLADALIAPAVRWHFTVVARSSEGARSRFHRGRSGWAG